MKQSTETTEVRPPRLVYYEPDHDDATNDLVAAVLALRGYKLTSDAEWLTDSAEPQAMVTVEGDGAWTLHDGGAGTHLPPVEAFDSPTAYAKAIAGWLDDTDSPTPAERAQERGFEHDYRTWCACTICTAQTKCRRAEWIDGMRALVDLLAADPELPLPYHGTSAELTFFVHAGIGEEEDALTVAEKVARLVEPLSDLSCGVHADREAYGYRAVGRIGQVSVLVAAALDEVPLEAVDVARAELAGGVQ